MAINPVDSFLRGFAVVDQLESNRQLRDFREEEMSQTRKVWTRRDEQWARDDLARTQEGRRDKYEFYTKQIMDEIAANGVKVKDMQIANGISEEEAEKAQVEYYNSIYRGQGNSSGSGEEFIMSEVIKRMHLDDDGFAEGWALAHGRDPAAGPTVSNGSPVGNIGVVGADKSPNGQAGVFIDVNTPEGKRIMTEQRTSAANDRVDLMTPTVKGQINFFGSEFMSARTPALLRLREQLVQAEGGLTGKPSATTDTAPSATVVSGSGGGTAAVTNTGNTARRGAGPELSAEDEADIATTIQGDQDAARERIATARASGDTRPANVIANDPALFGEEQAAAPPPPADAAVPPSNGFDGPYAPEVDPNQGLVDLVGQDPADDLIDLLEQPGKDRKNEEARRQSAGRLSLPSSEDIDRSLFEDGGRGALLPNTVKRAVAAADKADEELAALDQSTAFGLGQGARLEAKSALNRIYETGKGFVEDLGITGGDGAAIIKAEANFFRGMLGLPENGGEAEVPTTPAQSRKANNSPALNQGNAAKDPAAAVAAAQGSAPTSQAAAEKSASTLASASRSKRRIPFRHEVINAASFVDAGVISEAEFHRFVRGGSFSAPVELTFHNMGKGVLVATTPQGVEYEYQAQGFGEGGSNTRQQFDDLTAYSEDRFRDKDGKVMHGLLNRFRNEYNVALLQFGIDPKNTTPLLVDRFAEGLRLVDNFTADPSQNLFGRGGGDFNWFGDPELGPNNMALGATAVAAGIRGDSANRYLHDYGITFRNSIPRNGFDGKAFIDTVELIEADVRRLANGARANALKGDDARYNGLSIDNIRTDLTKALVAEQQERERARYAAAQGN